MKSLLKELRDNEYKMTHSKMGNEYVVEEYQTSSGKLFALFFSAEGRTGYIWKDAWRKVSNLYRWRIERAMRRGAEKE